MWTKVFSLTKRCRNISTSRKFISCSTMSSWLRLWAVLMVSTPSNLNTSTSIIPNVITQSKWHNSLSIRRELIFMTHTLQSGLAFSNHLRTPMQRLYQLMNLMNPKVTMAERLLTQRSHQKKNTQLLLSSTTPLSLHPILQRHLHYKFTAHPNHLQLVTECVATEFLPALEMFLNDHMLRNILKPSTFHRFDLFKLISILFHQSHMSVITLLSSRNY